MCDISKLGLVASISTVFLCQGEQSNKVGGGGATDVIKILLNILKPTLFRCSVGRVLGCHFKAHGFDSHRGQAHFRINFVFRK